MTRRAAVAYVLAAAQVLPAAAGAAGRPAWLETLLAAPQPAGLPPAPAVVLLRQREVVVPGRGRLTVRHREAVRILTAGGAGHAVGIVAYYAPSRRVKRFESWQVRADGTTLHQGRGNASDVSLTGDALYSEARVLALTPEDPSPGDVFAFEWEREEEPLLPQWEWWWSDEVPVLASSFSLELADGGGPVAGFHNDAAITPARAGDRWTWSRSDVPAYESEPLAPDRRACAPWMSVDLGPADGPAGWSAVSAWCDPLLSGAAKVTPAVARRARELAPPGADPGAWARAIARYVQGLNYVALSIGVERGGGYVPRPADDVMAQGYGDCKDKTALCRALFEAAGLHAWPVLLNAADPAAVNPDWASPSQFDHCIVAVDLDPGVAGAPAAAVDAGALGRLVVFDPTATATPWGELPEPEQGSRALVVAGERGVLVTLPSRGRATRRIDSRFDGRLDAAGTLAGEAERAYGGAAAGEARAAWGAAGSAEAMQRLATRKLGSAHVSAARFEAGDAAAGGLAHTRFSLTAPRFGSGGATTLLFRPVVMPFDLPEAPADSARRCPIRLPAGSRADTVRIVLPPGFALDAPPDTVRLDAGFASYAAGWTVAGDTLAGTRELEFDDALLPAARWSEVVEFVRAVARLEDARILARRRR